MKNVILMLVGLLLISACCAKWHECAQLDGNSNAEQSEVEKSGQDFLGPGDYWPIPHPPLPPLHEAAANGDLRSLERILNSSKDVNQIEPFSNASALQIATERNQIEAVCLLLEHGADVDTRNILEQSPLISAAYFGRIEIARKLLSYGAAVNGVDDQGCSALWYAAKGGNLSLAELLVEAGAKCGACDDRGNTELHVAPSAGIVRLLLRAGADIKARNKLGATPLHTAAFMDETQALLRDRLSTTAPKTFSEASVTDSSILTLVQAGASIDSVDVLGRTPLDWAREHQNPNAVEILRHLADGVRLPAADDPSMRQ